MNKRKTLEEWKEELIGKQFGRLTVLDVRQHYNKNGKRSGFEVVCKCSCGKEVITRLDSINSGTKSCGCLKIEKSRENMIKALEWQKEHPEETLSIRKKNLSLANIWREKHPEEALQNSKKAVEKAKEVISKWRKENPEKARDIALYNLEKAHQWREEHLEEAREISQRTIEKAHQWREEHLEESKMILQENIKKAHQWKEEHPEEARQIWLSNLEKANSWIIEHPKEVEAQRTRAVMAMQLYKAEHPDIYNSKEENYFYIFLLSLGYLVERQVLIEGHYFDFRINNFLIEYNGSIYHRVRYENLGNPECKEPPGDSKCVNYHQNLRDLAIRNGYFLIQIWDYLWFLDRSFVENLIKDQLLGNANYRDYIEDCLLDNDYGFVVEGELCPPSKKWICTGYPLSIVDESYTKGRVLVYNSGYTKPKQKISSYSLCNSELETR